MVATLIALHKVKQLEVLGVGVQFPENALVGHTNLFISSTVVDISAKFIFQQVVTSICFCFVESVVVEAVVWKEPTGPARVFSRIIS